jgi:calcium-dependent protein kinase
LLYFKAYYISPDILLDNNHYDERTDLWSLGVILYVLVSGLPPFVGETEAEILDAVAHYKYALNGKSGSTKFHR